MEQEDGLSVVVIVRNRLDYTQRTIASLLDTITIPFFNLIIVDNSSTDEGMKEYMDFLEGEGSVVVRLPENVGWGAAVNIGLKRVSREDKYVLLLNNDVELRPNWYDESIQLLQTYPDIGVLGLWKHTSHGLMPGVEQRPGIVIKDQMPAVAWMFLQSTLNKIVPFAEHGPTNQKGGNGEDVTMCIKARQQGLIVCGPINDLAWHLDGY